MKIIEIDENDKLWKELLDVLPIYQPEASIDWLTVRRKRFISSHVLVSVEDDSINGFMRFCIRELPIKLNNETLLEATGEALGVNPVMRNKGIGKALQNKSLQLAKEAGCYQFRSFLFPEAKVLRHIKLSLGFGICPKGDELFPDDNSLLQFVRVL